MESLGELLRRGFELIQAGRLGEARAWVEQAVQAAPDSLDANALSGFVAAGQGRWKDAARWYGKASALMPTDANLAKSAGDCAFSAGESATAVEHLRRAVALRGRDIETIFSLGKALCFDDQTVEAVDVLRECIGRGRVSGETHAWLAQALRNAGRADEGLPHIAEALRRAPKNLQPASLRCSTMNYAAGVTARDVFEAHREYGEWLEEGLRGADRPLLRVSRGRRPEKLRIGLLSPDLRRHSVTHFLLPIVECLDTSGYEVACYQAGEEDAYSHRYRAASVLFRNVTSMSNTALAAQIATDEVHVLIDLAGHTTNSRVAVLGLRAAPVQMTYLGYPGTTGVRGVDWRITDALTDPPGSEPFSTEKLLRLEGCSHTFRPVIEVPQPAEPACVTDGVVTFGCFGAVQKFNDVLIGMLAQVLNAVPRSRLLLKHAGLKSEKSRAEMTMRLVHAGVGDPSRLLIEGPVAGGSEEMLRTYLRADIVLDTFPYHGTTTTCECLYMGVPVVTRVGDRSAARVGLSLLSAVGLNDLAAADAAEYVRTAAGLAGDVPRLKSLRAGLRERFLATIGDAAAFTRRFESAIESAWAKD